MKKAVLLLVTLTLAASTFAQQGLHVGLLGGPQSTWLINKNDSDDPNVKYAIGGVRGFFGASVDYHFLDKLGAGIELLYSLQGQDYNDRAGTTLYRKNVNYFKIPILLNFNSNPDGVAMFVGKFGPSIGITTSATGVVDANVPAGVPAFSVDLKSEFQSIQVGMVLGLGVGFNVAKVVVITAGIRLDGGLTDVLISNPNSRYFSYYDGTTQTNAATRNKTWGVAGGFELGVKYVVSTGGSKSRSKSKSYHRR